jgi:Tol biopolymer transport system component
VGGRTVWVSASTYGGHGDGDSYAAALSGDGRYVAFVSTAPDLVPGDTNGRADIFVRDLTTGALTRVNVSSTGVQGNGIRLMQLSASLSETGRYVAFQSDDTNLVAGGTGNCPVYDPRGQPCPNVFLRDMKTGDIRLISAPSLGGYTNGVSLDPAVDASGRHVAFVSDASNLVPGDTNQTSDVFVRDVLTGTTRRVSVAGSGAQADKANGSASISADGRYVAFTSAASNLVSGSIAGPVGVFVHDLKTGTTERVGVWGKWDDARHGGLSTSISGDGRYVAFASTATDLVPDDTNRTTDAFVRDTKTGAIRRVSLTGMGTQNSGWCGGPIISADGRYVLFECSPAPGLNGIYVRDLAAGSTREVDVSNAGKQVGGGHPAMSADGRYVAFDAVGSGLVPGARTDRSDVFLRGPAH